MRETERDRFAVVIERAAREESERRREWRARGGECLSEWSVGDHRAGCDSDLGQRSQPVPLAAWREAGR